MAVPHESPELLQAQYRAFARQIPMMYFILVTNTWGVASTHIATAPWWLTLAFPILMTVICSWRVLFWWSSVGVMPTPQAALRALNRTNRLCSVIAVSFTVWALTLYPYGDAYTKGHIAFYMAITVIGCIFCLTHLRPAAIKVAVIVNSAFVIFFVSTGNPTFIATAVNVALVSIGLLVIVVGNYRDFTRMIEARLRTEALSNENFRLANLDSLTELPNRRAFFAQLTEAFRTAHAEGRRLAVGILDLDGFKPVNDLHGHATGDKLLVEVARRLSSQCAGQQADLFRLGGDEFALILSDVTDDHAILALGENLCSALRAAFTLPDVTIQISGSVGFAVYPEMASSSEELFEHADYALYQGKRAKRGRAILFSSDHNAEIRLGASIEQALRMADLDSELKVLFQPIVDIASERAIGFEALARWTNPVLGDVSPAQFIPVAEQAGIIGRITCALLRKALTTAAHWPGDLRLSFNLSAHDLASPLTVMSIVSIVKASSFSARRLDLEITETAFVNDFGQIQQSIEMLRLLGCGISLDDFGTGYSSLSRLHALPLTKIKVDRSFVANLHEKPRSYKIVKSLITLSRDMNLNCIIEGVETKEELAALRQLGAQMAQGYFYSPPIPESKIDAFLRKPIETKALSA